MPDATSSRSSTNRKSTGCRTGSSASCKDSRESRLLLACLSPAYLKSEYCEWEFVEYLKYEIGHLHGFNGVAPIYFVEVPGWNDKGFEQQCAAWVAELRKRQHFDLRGNSVSASFLPVEVLRAMLGHPMSKRLFLSCASREFSDVRDQLTADCRFPDVDVKSHEEVRDFNTGGTTLEKLDTYIAGCNAIVHLFGQAVGTQAESAGIEALLRRHLDLPNRLPEAVP